MPTTFRPEPCGHRSSGAGPGLLFGGLHRITAERNGADRPLVHPVTGKIIYFRWWRNYRHPATDLRAVIQANGGFAQKDGLFAEGHYLVGGGYGMLRNAWHAATINPPAVAPGHASTAAVTLSGPAPPGGVTVPITTYEPVPSVALPASVTVPEGARSATFPVIAPNRGGGYTFQFSAKYGLTRMVTLDILPAIAWMKLEPAVVVGGNPVTGTVALQTPYRQERLTIALSSDNPRVASVPEGAAVEGQTHQAVFTVTTFPVRTATEVTIQANLGGAVWNATLKVLPAGSRVDGAIHGRSSSGG